MYFSQAIWCLIDFYFYDYFQQNSFFCIAYVSFVGMCLHFLKSPLLSQNLLLTLENSKMRFDIFHKIIDYF